ncbi:MAG: nucleotide exchange factor GrpE [Chthoniobacterales bacterium]
MARTTEIAVEDDFASTMQQLVAEAKKTVVPAEFSAQTEDRPAQSEDVRKEFAAINARIAGLEQVIASGFEKLATATPKSDVSEQLQRLDEQIVALRNTETVNQRLFNTLHQELKSYRDNFLRESLQKPFLRDLIMLFDDLSLISTQMSSSSGKAGKGAVGQWSANLENAIHSLLEILHRMEVNEIEAKERVDRNFHRVVSYEPADFAEEDGLIVMRMKRGFLWREQVLRPEEVVAKRFA